MIGKVLQARYQIIQSVGAGALGETYIALDNTRSLSDEFLNQRGNSTRLQTQCWNILRLYLVSESNNLSVFSNYLEIPQLVTAFEENQRFYVVQELIQEKLSTEISTMNAAD